MTPRSILIILAVIFLTACNSQPVHHNWKRVTQLTGTSLEFYFIVVEPAYSHDRKTYEDAADTSCHEDICEIGFFATRNDVPNETMTADFYQNGGWKDRHDTAHFFRNTNSGLRTLTWDCNFFPQPDLNSCSPVASPSAEILKAAQLRGNLRGFGKVRFGMPLSTVVSILGGSDAVTVLPNNGDRTIVRTQVVFHDRKFNAFFNIPGAGFSHLLMRWSDSIDEKACTVEAKKIAAFVANDFGKQDAFNYYDVGGKTFRYSWLFADGSTIILDNLDMKESDCTLDLDFETKAEAE